MALSQFRFKEATLAMRIVHERCCGLDVHKQTVVACVITPEGRETRTFGTMTIDLLALSSWLQRLQVRHLAMESTGVYWKPVYNLLEVSDFELLVVNAQHVKALPGRKTDVKDAVWIAELLQHGLVQGSHIPTVSSGSCASWCAIAPRWSKSKQPK